MATTTFQRLLDHYTQRHLDTLDYAAAVRGILASATPEMAHERLASLADSHGGSPVVKRGSKEWHYAIPAASVRPFFHLGSHLAAGEILPTAHGVVAADGSQIFPDNRDQFPFGLIRVVSFAVSYGSDKRPVVRTTMITPDDDELLGLLVSEDIQTHERNAFIGGLRDRAELAAAQRAVQDLDCTGPKVVMVDGPLHLFDPANKGVIHAHAQAIQGVLDAGATPCGIISGGDARYTVRLAGLLANVDSDKEWPGLTDYHVWSDLDDGEQSVVFGIASGYNEAAGQAGLPAVLFFYLKVGFSAMRVEIPSTLSAKQAYTLADVIRAEARGIDYPYPLIKAHEFAVLRGAERRAYVEQWQVALARAGLYDTNVSAKQWLKDLV